MNDTVSRFFTNEDKQDIDIEIPGNDNWWSRKAEYTWASKFIAKDDICLDVGSGIEHPFKYYIADNSKKCIAIDKDKNIIKLKKYKKLELKNINALNLSNEFENDSIDKIFAISLFDRMTFDEIQKCLIEFKKVIKVGGLIVITVSFPYLPTYRAISLIDKAGLNFVGDCNFDIEKEKVLRGRNGLKCYRLLLEKQEEIQEDTEKQKEIKPEETKPEKPFETK